MNSLDFNDKDAQISDRKYRFEKALTQFIAHAQKLSDSRFDAEKYPHVLIPVLTAETGKRYVKIISSESTAAGLLSTRSVYCFVDMTTGDVLKAASWKAPAKGIRGNIFAASNGKDAIMPYGAHYNG